MKRRDVLKTIPLATLGAAYACNSPVSVEDTSTSVPKPESFSVANPNSDNLSAHDHVHCDQFGIDYEGNPIADHLTGTGSDAGLKEHNPDEPHKMTLTKEEQDILNGSKGEVMAKVLKTIVMHGELFGAERLVDCGGAPHSSL